MIDGHEISFQFHFDPMNNDGCYLDEVADVSEEVHKLIMERFMQAEYRKPFTNISMSSSRSNTMHIDDSGITTYYPKKSEYYG